MARHIIQHGSTGEIRTVGDGALPYFPGWFILDTLEDGQPANTFYDAAAADFRYVNVTELGDPESAASVALRTALERAAGALVPNVTGDGTTDDAAVIQAKLTAAGAAGGGRVLLPGGSTGVVIIGATLSIPSNTTLEIGAGITLRRKPGFYGPLIVNAATGTGGRDSNVALIGGLTSAIDGGNNSGATGANLHHVKFRQVDGLTVRGFRASSTGGKYLVNVGNCTDFDVADIRFTSASSDGVHINGPASRGRIADISGSTADDMVSLTSTDYVAYNDTVGDITGVDISDIVGMTASSTALVKFATAADTRIDGITGRNWRHTGGRCAFSVAKDTGTINVGVIRVAQIYGWGIVYDGGKVDELHIDGWDVGGLASDLTAPALRMMSSFDLISVSDPYLDTGGTNNDLIFIDNAAAVTGDSITVRGGRVKGSGANVVQVAGTNGNVRRVVVDGLSRPGPSGGGVIKNRGTLGQAFLSNIDVNGAAWLADFGGTALTLIHASSCRVSNGTFNFPSGAVAQVMNCEGVSGGTGSTIASGTNVRSLTYGFAVDVTKLGNLTAVGDRCNNLNTSLTNGLLRGPATYDGTLWRSAADITKTS